MTEQEMLEAEKYWCENCCNWDKEEVQMDACSTCKLTGTRVFAQESGKECKCFNVPAENVIVPPCKVGDKVYVIRQCTCENTNGYNRMCEYYNDFMGECERGYQKCPYDKIIVPMCVTDVTMWSVIKNVGITVFLTREEAEQALKGGDQ